MLAEQLANTTHEPGTDGPGRRILIDALAARYGGTAYCSVQLARHLARRPGVAAVTIATRRGSIVQRGLAGERRVRLVVLPEASRGELVWRVAWEALRLRALVARDDCDLVISMSGMLPRAPGCRLVCLLFNPVMYERRSVANLVRAWAVRHTARRAEHLVAPSRLMAELVSASVRRTCAVVPLGIDHTVFSPSPTPGDEILCIADFYMHKRHDLVIDAWLRLRAPRPRLRLIGNPDVDPRTFSQLRTRIDSLSDAPSVVLEHHLPLEQLVRAYRHARVFVMASEHESFCVPLVESMACGVPPVVRDLVSLRETGGSGAAYVDGDDPAAWATLLQQLIDDDVTYERARAAAVKAAARFSWEEFAANIIAHS